VVSGDGDPEGGSRHWDIGAPLDSAGRASPVQALNR
jgi:hypothetical protein